MANALSHEATSGENTITTYIGTAHPWLCDMMEHVNARHIYAMFDDANMSYLARVGWSIRDVDQERAGWADVRNEIEFKSEIVSGSHLAVVTGTERVGKSSVTTYSEMRNSHNQILYANFRAVLVHFDLSKRRSLQIPDRYRKSASSMMWGK